MPNYCFECVNEKCEDKHKTVEIQMKMSEYSPEQFCKKCGERLNRTAESLVCGYLNDKDFYGKTSK